MDDRLEIPDERSRLPYFAGRDAELGAFERKLRACVPMVTAPAGGAHHWRAGLGKDAAGAQVRGAHRRQAFDPRRSRNAMLALAVVMRDSARQTLDIDEAKAAVVSAGHDGEAVDAGIESGALTLLHSDVSFGIPSFHRHMIDLLRQREQERAPATRCHGS